MSAGAGPVPRQPQAPKPRNWTAREGVRRSRAGVEYRYYDSPAYRVHMKDGSPMVNPRRRGKRFVMRTIGLSGRQFRKWRKAQNRAAAAGRPGGAP